MRPGNKRIGPLDTFRYLTVTFALVSHAMLNHGIENVVSEDVWLWIRSFTRSATPALAFLFGVMAEIVYYRRLQKDGHSRIFPRIYHRSFQCYAAFVGLAVLGVLVGIKRPVALIGNLGFLTGARYANIFSLYFFWLLALIPVLLARKRWGIWGVLGMIAGVWMVAPLITLVPDPPRYLSHLAGLVFGIGGGWGPSALHGLTFIGAGMITGNMLYARGQSRQKPIPAFMVLVAVSTVLLVYEIVSAGWHGFQYGIVEYSAYRAQNAPAYYAYGFVVSVVLIGVSYILYRVLPDGVLNIVNRIGSKTFSYFVIGNAVLIITSGIEVGSALSGFVLLAGYIVLYGGLTLAWARYTNSLRVGPVLRRRTQVWSEAVSARVHRRSRMSDISYS